MSPTISRFAGFGLLVASIGHVALRAGHDLLGGVWLLIFLGIFVVWIPVGLTVRRYDDILLDRGGWKIMLTGAPDWVRHTVYLTFGYSLLNFAIAFFTSMGSRQSRDPDFWIVGSGHAMAFYAAAWGLSQAAMYRTRLGIDWRCEGGHDIGPRDSFCGKCGARAVDTAPPV